MTRRRVYDNIHRTDDAAKVSLIRPPMVKLPGVARISAMLSETKEIFEQMVEWCDIVVLYSVPTTGVQTVILAQLLGKPVVFHSFDVLHRMTGYPILSWPTWTLERFVYRRVDKMVVISGALLHYMKEIGVQTDILLLPPAVNTELFNPKVSGTDFRRELGLDKEDFLVLYSGWLYDFSGLDMVMKSMKDLQEKIPTIKLIICGDGEFKPRLEQLRDQLGLGSSVKIVGRKPFEKMPSIVASADLCINPYLPDVRSTYAFPSKIAEYMAAGKPVLATDLPGTRSFLPSSSGVSLAPPKKFVQTLIDLAIDKTKLPESGRMVRKFCEYTFSLDSVTDKFGHVLEEALTSRMQRSTN
jgi:glycosyltransferase involved in cell wall biosynthesis